MGQWERGDLDSAGARGQVSAVLGPTNTGKTYLAIDRMLGHASGMIGFPLRLLARENYDRVVRLKGAGQAALITGEEKIVPPGARYFLCTVEAMPVERLVAYLAVDEIQLCADPERGHVFTDRLLHARGLEETMFLGADTIRPLVRRLVPEARIVSRPRFSSLTHAGARKLTRLPPRSAAVAFSAADVYALAEHLRRRRGGTAVVLGALSPRTRNAQVGMFEAGEVDYLVATDAIGMGLNLNLDHVWFARLSKFDGQKTRRLGPAEVAQIAGRAGRHTADGTFGTTGEAASLPPELVEAVEAHRFEPLDKVYWRNGTLDFGSPRLLLRSLERRPPRPELLRARESDDLRALVALARDPDVAERANHPGAVRLLWEVCQIPDFQKILSDEHARLLGRVFGFLAGAEQRLPGDWVAAHLARIDRRDGDIDTLVARIAHVRTWTYIAYRADWLDDARHWRERARAIEDGLSDALHDRLTNRFVDRRAAVLARRLNAGDDLLAAFKPDGTVLIEGEPGGRIEGFCLALDGDLPSLGAGAISAAARRLLRAETPALVRHLEHEADTAIALTARGALTWRGAPIARLSAGPSALRAKIEVLSNEVLDGRLRARVRARLAAWLERHIAARLAPLAGLAAIAAAPDLSAPLRGLLYQLDEALGAVPRHAVAAQVRALSRAERKRLAAAGVRLGRESVFLPRLLGARATGLRVLLWAVWAKADPPPPPPRHGTLAFAPDEPVDEAANEAYCLAAGYRRLRARDGAAVAIRVDALERLAHEARRLGVAGPFSATARLRRVSGCAGAELEIALAALRYKVLRGGPDARFAPPHGGVAKSTARRPRRGPGQDRAADSPFAKLRELSGR